MRWKMSAVQVYHVCCSGLPCAVFRYTMSAVQFYQVRCSCLPCPLCRPTMSAVKVYHVCCSCLPCALYRSTHDFILENLVHALQVWTIVEHVLFALRRYSSVYAMFNDCIVCFTHVLLSLCNVQCSYCLLYACTPQSMQCSMFGLRMYSSVYAMFNVCIVSVTQVLFNLCKVLNKE